MKKNNFGITSEEKWKQSYGRCVASDLNKVNLTGTLYILKSRINCVKK